MYVPAHCPKTFLTHVKMSLQIFKFLKTIINDRDMDKDGQE